MAPLFQFKSVTAVNPTQQPTENASNTEEKGLISQTLDKVFDAVKEEGEKAVKGADEVISKAAGIAPNQPEATADKTTPGFGDMKAAGQTQGTQAFQRTPDVSLSSGAPSLIADGAQPSRDKVPSLTPDMVGGLLTGDRGGNIFSLDASQSIGDRSSMSVPKAPAAEIPLSSVATLGGRGGMSPQITADFGDVLTKGTKIERSSQMQPIQGMGQSQDRSQGIGLVS